ncbi:MAG: hypothetical protein V1844_19760 [Pseudomonadota bacterium]
MLSNSESVETKLQRIAEKACKEPSCQFTNLFHMMDEELLRGCFEGDFIEDSYGFRPGRGCHDALRTLSLEVEGGSVHVIVDADRGSSTMFSTTG